MGKITGDTPYVSKKVYCRECKYFPKTKRADNGEPIEKCKLKEEILDYVDGGFMKEVFCSIKNRDGECCDYAER